MRGVFRQLRWSAAGVALMALTPALAAPATMRQVQRDSSGTLKVATAPVPVPAPDQVRIRVYSSTVNPFELRLIRNLPENPGGTPPSAGTISPSRAAMLKTPGTDIAGVVDAVGPGVTRFKVGDKVVGAARARGGGWADYAVIAENETVLKPAAMTYEEAAGLPTAGWAAVRAVNLVAPKPGEKVAVIGAAGGVGSVVVQLVADRKATVIAIASSKQIEFLKQLGVNQVVPYDKVTVTDHVKDVDIVINTVTGQSDAGVAYLRSGGRFTSMAGPASPDQCAAAKVTCIVPQGGGAEPRGPGYQQLVDAANRGGLKTFVEKRFPLEQADAALDELQAGHAQGKIVLNVVPESAAQR